MYREPDTSQNADPAAIEAALFPPAEPYANPPLSPPAEPLRFTLVELLVAMTAAAVMLALFRTLGIFGAVFAFVVAAVISLTAYSRDEQRRELLFDFIWGVVMPVVCFVFDPFVFKQGDPGSFLQNDALAFPWTSSGLHFYGWTFVAYPVLAWQLFALAIALVYGRLRGPWAAGFVGTLLVGLILAGGIGMFLAPLAAVGTIAMGIGLLGFTPLLTAYSFRRRVLMLRAQASKDLPRWKANLWALIGLVLAAAIPGGLGLVLLVTVRGWDAIWR